MTTKAMIVGAAAHTAIATQLALHGEAFVTGGGEIIDPERVVFASGDRDVIVAPEGRRFEVVDQEGLPDRLSIDRYSKHFTNGGNYVGVKFDGEEAPNVIEFCVSEGWVRRGKEKVVTRREVRDAEREYGKVEVYWRSKPSRQVRRQMARAAR